MAPGEAGGRGPPRRRVPTNPMRSAT